MPIPAMLVALARRLSAPFRRARLDRDMEDEMRLHLELESEELRRAGHDDATARRLAAAAFGGVARHKEAGHEARGSAWAATVGQDVRYTMRSLSRQRGFAAVAILTLALGIGATATIFGVVNGVLLEPMSYRSPDRLILVWDDLSVIGVPEAWVTGPEIVRLRSDAKAFEGFAAVAPRSLGLADGAGDAEQLRIISASANLFDVLGTPPARGRGFVAGEDRPDAPLVAVISDGLWRRRFGADPSVVGRRVQLDGAPATIVGVLPPRHEFAMQFSLAASATVDAYVPLRVDLASEPDDGHRYGLVARVRDDVPMQAAHEELRRVGNAVDVATYGGRGQFRFAPVALRERVVREVRPALLVLMGAVSLLVTIMAANLATLALARASRRHREFAVRRAIGATPGRLARQLLTETVVVSLLGALLGVMLAHWGIRTLVALAPQGLPRRDAIGVDPLVVAFTLGLGLVVGIGMGLAPLVHSLRRDISTVMRERAGTGASGMRTRGALVLGQMALSLVLLSGTALLLSSFVKLLRVQPGFDADRVLAVTLRASPARYPVERVSDFVMAYGERLRALPGVRAVGATTSPPLSGSVDQYNAIMPDSPILTGETRKDALLVDYAVATPGYFGAMGVRLARGRDFSPADANGTAPVAIIDESLARHYFPDGDAVGRRLQVFGDTVATVIGVVPHVRLYGLHFESRPQVYRSQLQTPARTLTFIIRTEGDPAALAPTARAALASLDPAQPVTSIEPMSGVVAQSLAERRLVLVLVAGFAITAIFLATLGVYGVTAAAVAQRTRELGIRLALGADARALLWLTLRKPMLFVGLGVAAGAGGALLASRFIRGMLYEVSPGDPVLLAAVAAGLVVVALLAGLVPARRATRLDPARVLQSD